METVQNLINTIREERERLSNDDPLVGELRMELAAALTLKARLEAQAAPSPA